MDLKVPLTLFLPIEPCAIVVATVCILIPSLAMEVVLLELAIVLIPIGKTVDP